MIEKHFSVSSLLNGEKTSIVKIMATFLAMLELTRLKRLKIKQDVDFGEIYCEKIDESEVLQSQETFSQTEAPTQE